MLRRTNDGDNNEIKFKHMFMIMKEKPILNEAKFLNPIHIKDEHVYAFLTEYYIHQDQLSWGRTEALGVVEIGILTAAFAKEGWIAATSLIVGSVVVWLIWCLVQRDWEMRDQSLSALDSVHAPRNISMACATKHWWWRGRTILRVIVCLILLTNILLAVAFLFHAKI